MRLKQLSYLLIISSVILLSFACNNKELPEIPYENNPVFNAVGTINNEPFALHAGKDNAFMVSKAANLNGVKQNSGRLSNGVSSISINIFDHHVDIPNLTGTFLEKQNYKIAEQYGNTDLFMITPQNFSNNGEIDYILWTIDGAQQNSSTLAIYEPGKYNICAEVFFFNGSQAKTCNTVFVGMESDADFALNWYLDQNESINAYISTQNNTISNIKWFIDGVYQSDTNTLNLLTSLSKFKLKAEVQFQNGAVAEREIFINSSVKALGIEDFVAISKNAIKKWDSSVQFTIEKEGITYMSVQNSTNDATFVVNEISEFKTNADGTPVKLLKGTLNSPFRNLSTGNIVNGNFEIEIGVGY